MPRETPEHPIVCLHAEPGGATWFSHQLDGLGVVPWDTPAALALSPREPESLDRWVDGAVAAIAAIGGGRVHVLATGPAAYGAIVLAVRRPELVASLLLGDPEIDEGGVGSRVDGLLPGVTAPTLVIASAPGPDHETAAAQRIAGGIDNGVFVIIDGCQVPAHRERGTSFNEWVISFTIIAEGLVALGPDRQEEVSV